jgi:hypothetical protein
MKIKPRYLEKVEQLRDIHPVLQQPGLHHINVAHDDWCNLLRGKGECNCNPNVTYVATEGRN